MRSVSCAAASALVSLSLSACGHVPLTSIPKLLKIDFATTNIAEMRAAVRLPADIRPQPGGVILKVTSEPGAGGRHERSYALEEVADPLERAPLLGAAKDGHLVVYRLGLRDAAQLAAFRQEMAAVEKSSGRKNRGSISIGAEKVCRTGALQDKPLYATSFLKTSETDGFVVLTSNVDVRGLAKAYNVDLGTAIPECGALASTAPRAGS